MATNRNRLSEILASFEYWVNARNLALAPIILLFANVSVFEDMLTLIPLNLCFPGYCGGSDARKALMSAANCFLRADRSSRYINMNKLNIEKPSVLALDILLGLLNALFVHDTLLSRMIVELGPNVFAFQQLGSRELPATVPEVVYDPTLAASLERVSGYYSWVVAITRWYEAELAAVTCHRHL
uniref:Uncharacterized protein n=1 Tax=Coccidioides posadasii RMSCC 3488 TaxID=454284 RepID=A0A0J6F8B7_COCPO|nr:hypothetical protein CPAG_02767 [Coccidioides posadasii RMSCC 3488]